MKRYISITLLCSHMLYSLNSLADQPWRGSIITDTERCIIPIGKSLCSVDMSINYNVSNACLWIRRDNDSMQLSSCINGNSSRLDYINRTGLNFELRAGTTPTGALLAKKFILGEKTPTFMADPVKGISLQWLNGRRQSMTAVAKFLSDPNHCVSTDNVEVKPFDFANDIDIILNNTLTTLRTGGFNWVRIIISPQDLLTLASTNDSLNDRCKYSPESVLPKLAQHHIDDYKQLFSIIKSHGFKIELLLPSIDDSLIDIEGSTQWIESVLIGMPAHLVDLVALGADIQPGIHSPASAWLIAHVEYFQNHPLSKLRNFSYTFDTTVRRNDDELKTYLAWVKDNVPTLPVIPLNLYANRAQHVSGEHYISYTNEAKHKLNIYFAAGLSQPPWIDEYGFKVQKPLATGPDFIALPGGFTVEDQRMAYGGFLQAVHCDLGIKKGRIIPSMAWHGGVDYYHGSWFQHYAPYPESWGDSMNANSLYNLFSPVNSARYIEAWNAYDKLDGNWGFFSHYGEYPYTNGLQPVPTITFDKIKQFNLSNGCIDE